MCTMYWAACNFTSDNCSPQVYTGYNMSKLMAFDSCNEIVLNTIEHSPLKITYCIKDTRHRNSDSPRKGVSVQKHGYGGV